MANPYLKQYLMTAGPTPLPPAVSQVMAEPILYHRAPAFIEVYARALERLKRVFQTENDVLCSPPRAPAGWSPPSPTSSRPGEAALVASCGKFGERWAELVRRLRRRHGPPRRGLGQEGRARRPRPAAGREPGRRGRLHHALGDLHRRGQRRPGARGGRPRHARDRGRRRLGPRRRPLHQDAWGVDVVVAGSQKALMCPPGLAFASVNERALARAAERAGAALLLRLAERPPRASARTRPTARSPRPSSSWRSTSRSS